MHFLRRRWERNWPEMRATLRGGMPHFVFHPQPDDVADAVPVFVFHSVEPDSFRADLRFLCDNGYTTLAADSLLDHLQGRRPAPRRAVVLSFDDGAVNLHRAVFPALVEYRQRAVAFVVPRYIDAATTPGGPGGDDARRPCTWDELREMHDSGLVDFQSHTLEHRHVPAWPRPVPLTGVAPEFTSCLQEPLPLEEDFRRSREVLEARLGKPIRHLAFPRFDGSDEALIAGRNAGFRAFWWGLLPGRPMNTPAGAGAAPDAAAAHVVRLSGEFVRRLPGRDRVPLAAVLRARYLAAARNWIRA